MAREYPFQVVPKPNVLPEAVAQSSTELIGRSLQQALSMGMQAATLGLTAKKEDHDKNIVFAEAASKMMLVGEEIKQKYNLTKLEMDKNDEDILYRQAAEKLEQSENDRVDLEKKVKYGLAATIAGQPIEEVNKLMDPNGNGSSLMTPEVLQFAEEKYGERLAMEDLNSTLQTIDAEFLKDPTVTFDKIIEGVANNRKFDNGVVASYYLANLRENASQFYSSKQLEHSRKMVKDGLETTKLGFVNKVNLLARSGKFNFNALNDAVSGLENDIRRSNPAMGTAEFAAHLSEAVDTAFSEDMIRTNFADIQATIIALDKKAQEQPEIYSKANATAQGLLSSLSQRVEKVRNENMQQNYDEFKARIDGARDVSSLESVSKAMVAVAEKNGFTSAGYTKLQDLLLTTREKAQRSQIVSEVLSGSNTQSALTSADDHEIDRQMNERAAANKWDFAKLIGETASRGGNLTKSQLDSLNGLANVKVDPARPETATAVMNAVAGFEAVRAANPRLAREISEKDGGGRRLSVFADNYYYFGINPANAAQELQSATETDFIEADSILSGKIDSKAAKKAADVEAIIASENNGWFSWDIDRPIAEATRGYRAAFRYSYAMIKSQGKITDPTQLTDAARVQATSLLQRGFYRVSVGTDDVFPDTHFVSKNRFPFDPASNMGENFQQVLDKTFYSERWKVYLANRNSIGDIDDITVDLDNAEVTRVSEMQNGRNVTVMGPYSVPFVNRKTGMLLTDKDGNIVRFSVPTSEEGLKEALKNIRDERQQMTRQLMQNRGW